MNEKEIDALITLLDDDDKEVSQLIEEKILSIGRDVIPHLENAWGQSFDPEKQERLLQIIHKLQFEDTLAALSVWRQRPYDLLEGAILVARHQYPDLEDDAIKQQLNQIKRDIWIEINDNLTAYEKVKVINKVLFELHQFKGNTANYHLPANSYINCVLENKKGNPLMLSLIYSYLAQQLDIPIYGVNLPEHFIMAYVDELNILREAFNENNTNVLFYINAFSKGIVFGKNEISQFLDKLKLEHEKIFFEPCTVLEMIQRLVRNLVYSYQKIGDTEKEAELNRMLQILA
ncbi:MAG: transglutaminase family protein [Bacteroidetes bacterium]|nr:transglutaminase family protein [Bacteroidota bacterium]